jgi:hypothetical protein
MLVKQVQMYDRLTSAFCNTDFLALYARNISSSNPRPDEDAVPLLNPFDIQCEWCYATFVNCDHTDLAICFLPMTLACTVYSCMRSATCNLKDHSMWPYSPQDLSYAPSLLGAFARFHSFEDPESKRLVSFLDREQRLVSYDTIAFYRSILPDGFHVVMPITWAKCVEALLHALTSADIEEQ